MPAIYHRRERHRTVARGDLQKTGSITVANPDRLFTIAVGHERESLPVG
jgi:hypothetical protein